MSGKLRVGCSPLTKTIYAGGLGKDGKTWLSNRTDVTMDALLAVIDHVGTGNTMTLSSTDGSPSYEIEVRAVVTTQPQQTGGPT